MKYPPVLVFMKGDSGKLSDKTRAQIGTVGSKKRDDMPESDFLEPKEKKYPWKLGGKPSRKMLLAAMRRATMQGDSAIASKAKSLLKKHFGTGDDKD